MKIIVGLKDSRNTIELKGKKLTGTSIMTVSKDKDVMSLINGGILDFKGVSDEVDDSDNKSSIDENKSTKGAKN